MKITPLVLSIPPYISTTWNNIITLKPEKTDNIYNLTVILKSGERVLIPHLTQAEIQQILESHAQYTETKPATFPVPFSFSIPSKTEGTLAALGESMQHNEQLANLPNIPPEILHKIVLIAKAFGLEFTKFEPAKPNCNCIYCQLSNALSPTEEIVQDEELTFRDWQVKELTDKCYSVISPLDENEQYNVFLGEPMGCTCGQNNCEHIKAVLHS